MRIKYKTTLIIIVLSILISISTLAQTYSNTTISTPRGTSVSAWLLTSGEMSQQQKDYWLSYWLNYYSNRITYEGDATYTYNCHAYAWWVSEGQSEVWLNDPSQYWGDDSYIEVASQTNASKVSFGTADHSAITTGTANYFISKWGPSPRFAHNVEDCPYDNSDMHYYARPYLTGNTSLLCSSGSQYTINDLPTECTITWACSGNISRVSAQGSNPCTFQAYGSGDGWIEATITSNVDAIVLPRINLWVGTPILNYVTGPESGYTYNTYTFYADPRRDPLSQAEYTWILNPLNGNSVRPYYDYADIAFYTSGYYQVVARAENSCGLSEWAVSEISISENYSYSLSPNPASGNLTIIVTKLATTEADDTNPELTTYTVSIFNFYGILQSSVKKTGTNFTIPVGNLKDGNYIVQIRNGKKTKSLPLIIKHN